MAKKQFSFDDYWAQQVFKVRAGDKDYIWALCRRQFGPGDIERKGIGVKIGVSEEQIFDMETDNDPESTTFGKRIPKKRIVYDASGNPRNEPMPIETRLKFTDEWTPTNVKNYKKMVGHSAVFGNTQFYVVINGDKYTVEDPDEFWVMSVAEAKKTYKPKGRKAQEAKAQLQ